MLNVGRATQWAFVDGLGINLMIDPETFGLAILILTQVVSATLRQGTPRGITGRELGGYCPHDGFYMHQAKV